VTVIELGQIEDISADFFAWLKFPGNGHPADIVYIFGQQAILNIRRRGQVLLKAFLFPD
jgi:hypothetical protein